ncbi:hypothetical protein PVIIG_06435 [Plasmodium vivax India VII]|uniref:STP1 protein n=1 Tax=Plasmodium vivax India VII TaxID=1077284 RepID=A0A0J9S2D9_PLAVI|nr:hypothetical protein PVIIG_06435 [Plasmodium vivax India VII]
MQNVTSKIFKLDLNVPDNVKNNIKYKEISQRFQYALVEYYTTFKNHDYTTDTHRKCRGLNYFLDDLRDEFNKYIVPLLPRKTKENYWNREVEEKLLKNLQEKTKGSCARNPTHYNKEIRILRKEIEDYCDERDELIGTLSSLSINEHEKCERFRYWMVDSLVYFWNDYYWRKYITYRSMIKPFQFENKCDVVTLFDSPFQCERGRTFREHIPVHIRDIYKLNDEYFPPVNIVPNNKEDISFLQSKKIAPYVEHEHKENKTYDIPELEEAPVIPDSLYFYKTSTSPNSQSIKELGKKDETDTHKSKIYKYKQVEIICKIHFRLAQDIIQLILKTNLRVHLKKIRLYFNTLLLSQFL